MHDQSHKFLFYVDTSSALSTTQREIMLSICALGFAPPLATRGSTPLPVVMQAHHHLFVSPRRPRTCFAKSDPLLLTRCQDVYGGGSNRKWAPSWKSGPIPKYKSGATGAGGGRVAFASGWNPSWKS